MTAPPTHPRKASLDLRHRLTDGYEQGVVAAAGLIAHGRGEALDYFLGETTHKIAYEAERAAAAALLAAEKPAISVNGNTAALCPKDAVSLAKATGSRLEVNLFYGDKGRKERILDILLAQGADRVWGVGVKEPTIPGLDSERARSDQAIVEADVVLVLLEDGDRTEKLAKMGKKVIAVDLNPLSRTAQKADISIVDNIVRALPNIIKAAEEFHDLDREKLNAIVEAFDNKQNLKDMEKILRQGIH